MQAQIIIPFLWFDRNAEEAMDYYVSVFKDGGKDAEVIGITRYPSGITEGPMAGFDGQVLNGTFELAGQRFMCLDGGPIFKFNESVSLMVECADQAEIDYFWEKLSAVPESEQCGWCKDKFGLSWQIVPAELSEIMTDPQNGPTAMQKLMNMKKLNIAELKGEA